MCIPPPLVLVHLVGVSTTNPPGEEVRRPDHAGPPTHSHALITENLRLHSSPVRNHSHSYSLRCRATRTRPGRDVRSTVTLSRASSSAVRLRRLKARGSKRP